MKMKWSEEEERTLRERIKTSTFAEVAGALGRSISSCENKAYVMGIVKGSPWWGQEEEEKLFRHASQSPRLSYNEMKKLSFPRRSALAIRIKKCRIAKAIR